MEKQPTYILNKSKEKNSLDIYGKLFGYSIPSNGNLKKAKCILDLYLAFNLGS